MATLIMEIEPERVLNTFSVDLKMLFEAIVIQSVGPPYGFLFSRKLGG